MLTIVISWHKLLFLSHFPIWKRTTQHPFTIWKLHNKPKRSYYNYKSKDGQNPPKTDIENEDHREKVIVVNYVDPWTINGYALLGGCSTDGETRTWESWRETSGRWDNRTRDGGVVDVPWDVDIGRKCGGGGDDSGRSWERSVTGDGRPDAGGGGGGGSVSLDPSRPDGLRKKWDVTLTWRSVQLFDFLH